eukprot:Opistho-2@81034
MKIFLVEDSLMIRSLLVRTIESLDDAMVVGEAECEETAVALIGHSKPDLVLLDLHLAFGGSGLRVLERLKQDGFKGRTFVMTNQVLDAYRSAAARLGAERFYDKAMQMPDLIDDLAILLAKDNGTSATRH